MENKTADQILDERINAFFDKFPDVKEIECRDTKFIEDEKKKATGSFLMHDYAKVYAAIEDYLAENPKTNAVFDCSCDDSEKNLFICSQYNFKFTCFSVQEYELMRKFTQNPVIMRSPIMSEEDLQKLASVGGNIEHFVVDNIEYMERVQKYFPQARFLVYFYPKCTGRFGADILQTYALIKRSQELNVKIEGIYLAGGNEEDEVIEDLDKAISDVKKLFNYFNIEMDHVLFDEDYLDFSREFEGAKNNSTIINTYFTEEYITAVEQIASVKVEEEKKEIRYYLRLGDMFLGRFYMNLDDTKPKKLAGKKYNCTFYGPTCDTSDCVIEDIQFMKLKANDFVTFENVGCNSIVFTGSNFNGLTDTYTTINVFNNWNFGEE